MFKTEWPLSGVVNERIVNIIIDRSFIDSDGTRWIIDFKSSRHEDDNLAPFLLQEKQRYLKQMHLYAQILKLFSPEPVKLGLYFPLLKGWIEWDAENSG